MYFIPFWIGMYYVSSTTFLPAILTNIMHPSIDHFQERFLIEKLYRVSNNRVPFSFFFLYENRIEF